jgi:hypothetical protein
MDIVNIKITFEDTFSGCTTTKECSRSLDTFEKMKQSIGQVVKQFDKKSQISYTWKVVKVEQAN